MGRIKILAFVSLHGAGGMNINESQLINALSKYSESIYVFSFISIRRMMFRKTPKPMITMNNNVKVIMLPGIRLPIIFLPIRVFYYGLISLFCLTTQKSLNIKSIYIRDRYVGVPMLMLKFLIKKPILIKFGGFIADELHPNIRSSPLGKTFYTLETLIDIYLLRHADIILVSSLTMKESIEKMFGIKSKILLCPSGIDLEKIERIMRQENVKKDDKVRIGFLGSLTWWQGVDILTEAVAIVKEKLPNIELFIVGDGPMREKVVNMCKKHKIAYTITGFVPHEEALKYLRSFDVLVLPRRKTSATEANIPIKVVEAWTLGVPVIVTKHRVFLDYQIKNYEDVIYCEPEPNSVANAIFTLLTNNELKETLKTNGPKLARQFDYDKIAERILRAIID